MNGVALRCPNCGTTQSHPGECDACSEGEVRYFCSNHTPGRWLEDAECKDCGARFGDAPRKAPEAPRAASTKPVHRTRRPERTSPVPEDAASSSSVRRTTRPPVVEPEEAVSPTLRDLLTHLSRERERTGYTVEEVPRYEPAAEVPRRSPFLVGCLLRIVLLVVVLIAAAVLGLFVLFGGG